MPHCIVTKRRSFEQLRMFQRSFKLVWQAKQHFDLRHTRSLRCVCLVHTINNSSSNNATQWSGIAAQAAAAGADTVAARYIDAGGRQQRVFHLSAASTVPRAVPVYLIEYEATATV